MATSGIEISNKKKPLYDISDQEIVDWLNKNGQKPYRANQLIKHIFEQRKPLETLSTWPKELLNKFQKQYGPSLTLNNKQISKDGTIKWLFALDDSKYIETVLMSYPKRATVCISSQAGCAMGCTFCATGQAGFDRHLNVAEIVEQVVLACHEAEKANRKVTNIVFMGMGEPLANTDNVKAACEILVRQMKFSPRNITISTVGFVPGINKIAKWDLPVTLAVSLHSPFDDLRETMIPLNKRYSIEKVLDAAVDFSRSHSRRVSFEYAAIEDVNINNKCANKLGKLLKNFQGSGGAHLNIIPLNKTKLFDGAPGNSKEINNFAEIVRSYGVSVTIRRNKGNDIDAACGQLRERATSAE